MLSNNFKIGVHTLVLAEISQGFILPGVLGLESVSHCILKVVMRPSAQVVHGLLEKTGVSTTCTKL